MLFQRPNTTWLDTVTSQANVVMRHLQVSFHLSSSHSILWVCVAYQVFTCIWKAGVTSHLWKFNGNVWPLSVIVWKLFSGGEWNSPEPSLCRSHSRERNASLFLMSMSLAMPKVWHPRYRLMKAIELMFFSFPWQVENASVVLKDQVKGERFSARELWWQSLLLVTLTEQGKGIQFSSFISTFLIKWGIRQTKMVQHYSLS